VSRPGDDGTGPHPGRQRVSLGLAAGLTFPGNALRLTGLHANPPSSAALFGLAIVGAAFMLSWGAEVAPELLVAGLYAWRLNTSAGLGTLVSSKVNQWTLLVGTLRIVFAIASGGTHPTAGGAAAHRGPVGVRGGGAVEPVDLGEGGARPLQPVLGPVRDRGHRARVGPRRAAGGVSILYMVLAFGIVLRARRQVPQLLRVGLRTPYAELTAGP
jgi:hypothetical protein